jgi:cyanophycinase
MLSLIAFAFTLTAHSFAADATTPIPEPRLRPSGLEGAVILDTNDRPGEATVARFFKLAQSAQDKRLNVILGAVAKPLVLVLGEAKADGILDLLKARPAGTLEVIKINNAASANAALDSMRKSTGIWIFTSAGPAETQEMLKVTLFHKVLRDVRIRGGVVAASGPAASLLAASFITATGEARPGLAILPGMLIARDAGGGEDAKALETSLQQTPAVLGVRLGSGSTLLVTEREMRVLGNGKISLQMARSSTREPRAVTLQSGRLVDYNEMRRAALGRSQSPYPPKELPTPEVPKGTLVIVGGGGMPQDIAKRFVELGGGADGTFVVLPISNPDPLLQNMGDGFLRRQGAKNVFVIKDREQNDLESPKNVEILKKATGVWFGGGRQWRFVDAYEGTKIHDLFRDVLRRGGVIGGSSAGATIQGDYLCRGAPGGPNNIICEGYERGLGFLPGVAIDQHFTQRNRLKDMVLLMKTYPQFLGIGLDEATAIVVQGHLAQVMGTNKVHFYDRRKPVEEGKPDHESLKAGDRYDLKERKSVSVEETK